MSEASGRFIESMGRHFEEEGVPRIAGRLFGQLMVQTGDASLDDLAEALQVSKGSISSNARLLEDWGVAERITRPGDRRDFYRLAPDAHDRLLKRRIERIEVMIERLTEAREELGTSEGAPAERFEEGIRFNTLAIEALRKLRSDFAGSRRR